VISRSMAFSHSKRGTSRQRGNGPERRDALRRRTPQAVRFQRGVSGTARWPRACWLRSEANSAVDVQRVSARTGSGRRNRGTARFVMWSMRCSGPLPCAGRSIPSNPCVPRASARRFVPGRSASPIDAADAASTVTARIAFAPSEAPSRGRAASTANERAPAGRFRPATT
jgi:hypothetical protein